MPDFPPRFDPSGRLLAEMAPGDNSPALTVSEISGLLKRTVEERFDRVRVRGEISGFKRAASGHCYMCLKDDNAVIDGVMWKTGAARLPFRPEDGIEVIATGKLTTYPGRSKYQIVVESMEIAGEGALMQLLERLKERLGAEGLFDPAAKKPLPFLPRVIGVVTSPTGAVIRDILHRLADRCPTQVLLWPVKVQGDGSAEEVARAIAGFNGLTGEGPLPRPDLLIVGRGGGSIEDLWAFNEEVVVRAVAASAIPIISAVGHETDTTLCDHAADVRAPTPTAAAEIAVPVRAELIAHLRQQQMRADRAARRARDLAAERLAACARHLPKPEELIAERRQRVDDLGHRLQRGLQLRISQARHQLSDAGGALRPALLRQRVAEERRRLSTLRLSPVLLQRRIVECRTRFDALARLAASLDPDRPLSRGFARVMADGHLVRTPEQARAAEQVMLHFADGEVTAQVTEGSGEAAPLSPRPSARAVRPRPAERPPRGEPGQDDLFG